jgi:hypothetical protein
MPSLHHYTSSTSAASISGSQSICSSSSTYSISAVADTIPREQRPTLISPGLRTPSWSEPKQRRGHRRSISSSDSSGSGGLFRRGTGLSSRSSSGDGSEDDSSSDAVMSVIYATRIRAPMALVAALLIDTRSYPKWNLFYPRCTVTHQPRSVAPLPALLRNEPMVGAVGDLPTTLREGTSFFAEYTVGLPKDHGLNPLKTPYSKKIKDSPPMQVTALEQFEREDGRVGLRLAWCVKKGRLGKMLMRTERVQEIVPSLEDPDVVDYVCWETYYGFLAANVKPSWWAGVKDGHAAWVDGLKKYAEEKATTTAAAMEAAMRTRTL